MDLRLQRQRRSCRDERRSRLRREHLPRLARPSRRGRLLALPFGSGRIHVAQPDHRRRHRGLLHVRRLQRASVPRGSGAGVELHAGPTRARHVHSEADCLSTDVAKPVSCSAVRAPRVRQDLWLQRGEPRNVRDDRRRRHGSAGCGRKIRGRRLVHPTRHDQLRDEPVRGASGKSAGGAERERASADLRGRRADNRQHGVRRERSIGRLRTAASGRSLDHVRARTTHWPAVVEPERHPARRGDEPALCYDRVGNLVSSGEIPNASCTPSPTMGTASTATVTASQWPAGAEPASRNYTYWDDYRLAKSTTTYLDPSHRTTCSCLPTSLRPWR